MSTRAVWHLGIAPVVPIAVALLALRHDTDVSADPRTVLYELLYDAILEIRAYAYQEPPGAGAIAVLSNLVHNLPMALARASGPADHEAILQEMWTRSEEQPDGRRWLEHRLNQLAFDVCLLDGA